MTAIVMVRERHRAWPLEALGTARILALSDLQGGRAIRAKARLVDALDRKQRCRNWRHVRAEKVVASWSRCSYPPRPRRHARRGAVDGCRAVSLPASPAFSAYFGPIVAGARDNIERERSGPKRCVNTTTALTTNALGGANVAEPDPTIVARFWAKVDKSGGPDACWLWRGALTHDGYGKFSPSHRAMHRSHRFSFELIAGPIAPTLQVLHLCDERYPVDDISYRACVNPSHMRTGTNAENVADMNKKGRRWTLARPRPVREKVKNASPVFTGFLGGEGNLQAKLTDADVLEIRARLRAGNTCVAIARDFKVHYTQISRIKNRRKWAHLD